MILTCPNCHSQFSVNLAAFGHDGRHVKCSACGEVWWQEPSLDEMLDDIAADINQDMEDQAYFDEDDGDGDNKIRGRGRGNLKQDEELFTSEDEFVRHSQPRVQAFVSQEGRRVAYLAAVIIFFVILMFLLLMSNPLMKRYPAMQGFYKFFGIYMEVPDLLSLMFEGVYADVQGGAVNVSGRIINLSRKAWLMPMIEVSVHKVSSLPKDERSGHEEIVARWIEPPPQKMLDAEKEVQFSYSRHVSFGEKGGVSDSQDSAAGEYMARVRFVVGDFFDYLELSQ